MSRLHAMSALDVTKTRIHRDLKCFGVETLYKSYIFGFGRCVICDLCVELSMVVSNPMWTCANNAMSDVDTASVSCHAWGCSCAHVRIFVKDVLGDGKDTPDVHMAVVWCSRNVRGRVFRGCFVCVTFDANCGDTLCARRQFEYTQVCRYCVRSINTFTTIGCPPLEFSLLWGL